VYSKKFRTYMDYRIARILWKICELKFLEKTVGRRI